MVKVRVAKMQGLDDLIVLEMILKNYTNSEWLVKVRGNHSSMRIGDERAGQRDQQPQLLGQEVYYRRVVGSDLSPHLLNILES